MYFLKPCASVTACLLGVLVWTLPLFSAEQKLDWKSEWERTVAAAKKEGQVIVYKHGPIAPLEAGIFQKAFPEIKLVSVQGLGAQIPQRIFAERRAGKYLADVVIHGINPNYIVFHHARVLDPIKPALILPEVVDESKWWRGKHHYADPESKFVFIHASTMGNSGVSFNTRLVKSGEVRSYWDILNPKWKGKIEIRDIVGSPALGSGQMIFFYHNPELGPEFIRRLFGEMNVTLFRDFRQGTDWLANGKFAICFFCREIDKAKSQGLPVEEAGRMKEGATLSAAGYSVVLMNGAPHPNAAKVFLNWYLSKVGQVTLMSELTRAGENVPQSLREDIPKEVLDLLPPENLRVKGANYFDLFRPELLNMEPIYSVIKDALRESGKN